METASYDWQKASSYWGMERIRNARNPLAAVLSFSQPDAVNKTYHQWECTEIFHILGNVKGKSVADFGCGWGRLTLHLAAQGAHITAIDAADGMLELLSRHAKAADLQAYITTLHAPVHEVPLRESSYDAVVCAGVFEHVPEDHRELSLRSMYRILKPGGALVLVLNNARSEYLRTGEDNPYRKGVQFESGYFCQLVFPDEIQSMLQAIGFEAEKCAANTAYAHVRAKNMPEGEALSRELAEALKTDLQREKLTEEDDRFADHFIFKAIKKNT